MQASNLLNIFVISLITQEETINTRQKTLLIDTFQSVENVLTPTSRLLAEPLVAGLARGAAGVLASVLAALLAARARILRAGQRPRRGAAAVRGAASHCDDRRGL